MPLRISYCGQCANFAPEFKRTLTRLQQEYPQQLRVVELECMAACQNGPVAMIEYDYYERIAPERFYELVTARLQQQAESPTP